MALVGNGVELEADEVLAGGECGHCPWSGGDGPSSRTLGVSLGLAASRPEELAGAAEGWTRPWEVCPCGNEGVSAALGVEAVPRFGRPHRGVVGT